MDCVTQHFTTQHTSHNSSTDLTFLQPYRTNITVPIGLFSLHQPTTTKTTNWTMTALLFAVPNNMKKPTVQQAPVSLSGLFVCDGDDSVEEVGGDVDRFENETEVLTMDLAGIQVHVRQMAWHRANANQVWPGTFTLAEHIFNASGRYESCKVLELGSATGALALALAKTNKYNVITW
jgi:hypothetical protein